ncbi:efflux RND transporter periplasmic adaptor subunit [Sulfurovum sp.]|uniref:efflux RND transporter periplasmic adaptor subunit n=1 Tax=Sulfurovum sp. TaxID=1969726 RepID=UPI0025DACEFB|nr:efflux RND transporter periplasmic adaptor subunit [Sulfurovum sp.]
MQKIFKYLILALLLLALGMVFYNKVYIPKTTYDTVKPTVGDLNVEIFGIGNVGAEHIYNITAQTGGKILSLLTDEGEWVKKGDLLLTIDSVDLPQILEESKIAVDKARSEYLATQKELESLFAQEKLAQITYARFEKLKKESFASKAEYDKAKADLDVIDAQIAATQAHIASAKMEINRAQKAVDALLEKLSRYKVYAPVDGYVISRSVEVTQNVLTSQSIFQIVDPKSVWVKAYIDEKISGSVKVGQKANIQLRSQYEKRFSGTVKRIVAQSDAVTQEREVDVSFDKVPIPFYINEQAEVSIVSKTYKDVVKIDPKSLSYYKERSGVWTEKDGKAHFIPLKIIARGHKEVAVSGLDKETIILLEAPNKKPLREGARIH